jgi:hypothetical protein
MPAVILINIQSSPAKRELSIFLKYFVTSGSMPNAIAVLLITDKVR